MSAGETGEAPQPVDLEGVADRMRQMGYDIVPARPGEPHESLIARRDLEDRAVVLAIDGGGRFRATLSWIVGEWPSGDTIAGVTVRIVDAVSRTVTITGQAADAEAALAVMADLQAIAPWANAAG